MNSLICQLLYTSQHSFIDWFMPGFTVTVFSVVSSLADGPGFPLARWIRSFSLCCSLRIFCSLCCLCCCMDPCLRSEGFNCSRRDLCWALVLGLLGRLFTLPAK